jgi:hypothetical protein
LRGNSAEIHFPAAVYEQSFAVRKRHQSRIALSDIEKIYVQSVVGLRRAERMKTTSAKSKTKRIAELLRIILALNNFNFELWILNFELKSNGFQRFVRIVTTIRGKKYNK